MSSYKINSGQKSQNTEGDGPFEVSDIVTAVPIDITEEGDNPLVEINHNGDIYYAEVIRSNHRRFAQDSNILRRDIYRKIEANLNHPEKKYDPVRVKIVSPPDSRRDHYLVVCVPGRPIDADRRVGSTIQTFTPEEAHEFITGNNILYAMVTSRRIENVTRKLGGFGEDYAWSEEKDAIRILGYDSQGKKLEGLLKEMDRRSGSGVEKAIARDILHGSEKFDMKGISGGDKLLVKVVADNSHKRPRQVTYFFEPVVMIDKFDGAKDPKTGVPLRTGVINLEKGFLDGWEGTKDYSTGDIVVDLPIIRNFATETMGVVGVGYVKRPESEFKGLSWLDKRPPALKMVLVKGARDRVGKIVRQARIVSQKKAIITQMIDSKDPQIANSEDKHISFYQRPRKDTRHRGGGGVSVEVI